MCVGKRRGICDQLLALIVLVRCRLASNASQPRHAPAPSLAPDAIDLSLCPLGQDDRRASRGSRTYPAFLSFATAHAFHQHTRGDTLHDAIGSRPSPDPHSCDYSLEPPLSASMRARKPGQGIIVQRPGDLGLTERSFRQKALRAKASRRRGVKSSGRRTSWRSEHKGDRRS